MKQILSIFFILLLASTGSACIINQTHTNTNAGVNWPTASPTWGQSFMACQAGDIWEIAFWPNWTTTGIHSLVLSDAGCSNLWTVPNINISGGNVVIVDLSSGSGITRTVTSGNTYVFQLIGPGGSNLQINLSNVDPYANGQDIAGNCGSYGLDWWFRVGIDEPLPALPVELSAFDARLIEDVKAVELNFKTASESNASYFVIEHSTEERRFQDIGRIKAIGTSNQLQSYKFIHQLPPTGNNYYRLKQVDDNGSFEYSKVIHVLVNSPEPRFNISPNPAKEDIQISLNKPLEENLFVELYSLKGQKMYSKIFYAGTTNRSIDGDNLSPGIYFLKASRNGRTYCLERVVKQ